jgi:uncharacterized membrane protein
MKVLFCEHPYSHATDIGFYPEPGDSEFQRDLYKRAVARAESNVIIANLLTWSGIAAYVFAVGLCVYFIKRRHPDTWLIYLVLVGAAGLLWYAFAVREVPFYYVDSQGWICATL